MLGLAVAGDLLGERVDNLLDGRDVLEPQLLRDDLEIAHLVKGKRVRGGVRGEVRGGVRVQC